MSSPRGLEVGGIGGMGTEVPRFGRLSGEGERRGRDITSSGELRCERYDSGFVNKLTRNGRCRTFKCMLKLRRARLACGTYLIIDRKV